MENSHMVQFGFRMAQFALNGKIGTSLVLPALPRSFSSLAALVLATCSQGLHCGEILLNISELLECAFFSTQNAHLRPKTENHSAERCHPPLSAPSSWFPPISSQAASKPKRSRVCAHSSRSRDVIALHRLSYCQAQTLFAKTPLLPTGSKSSHAFFKIDHKKVRAFTFPWLAHKNLDV